MLFNCLSYTLLLRNTEIFRICATFSFVFSPLNKSRDKFFKIRFDILLHCFRHLTKALVPIVLKNPNLTALYLSSSQMVSCTRGARPTFSIT